MWVSNKEVIPTTMTIVSNLPEKLEQENVELRVIDTLKPLQSAWTSSLHVSEIRLRNAIDL